MIANKKTFALAFIMALFYSCSEIQQNIEDKAKQIQNTADEKFSEQLNKIDSTIQTLDTTIHENIDRQLEKADTLMNSLNENFE
jgi:hypothetical protein